MVKFIVASDWHYQGSNPRSRTDDYPATIEAKLREIFALAESERARAILCAGDLFNSPGVSIPTFLRLYRLLKESPCEILAIHGSPDHDGLAASIGRTWYQVLVEAGVVQDLETRPEYLSLLTEGLWLTGCGANPDTDHGLSDYLPPEHPTSSLPHLHIHLSHGMLLEQAPGHGFFRCTLLDQVAQDPNAPDVLICGHYHPGWGIKRIGKTLFVNPGALARTSATVVEMERPIQVAVLEIDGKYIDARLIPLQSARPGSEVLSRAHLEAAALREERTAEFLALLDAQDELRRLEVAEIVTRIADAEGLPEAVRAEALRRIAAAAEGGRVA